VDSSTYRSTHLLCHLPALLGDCQTDSDVCVPIGFGFTPGSWLVRNGCEGSCVAADYHCVHCDNIQLELKRGESLWRLFAKRLFPFYSKSNNWFDS